MKNFQEVIKKAVQGAPAVLAVVAPYDENTVSAVVMAKKEGVAEPRLFGNRQCISDALSSVGACGADYDIVECEKPVAVAIESIRNGECDFIMKGKVTTPALMSACLSKSAGLNLGKSISAIAVCQIPSYGKLLAVSDPALSIAPTLDQKIDFTQNMIQLLKALEVEIPKIALLSSMEEVSLKIPASMDAAIITQMNRRGQIQGAVIDGPLSFDNIVSEQSAKKKGLDSPVAGSADGIIVPNIECGNALIKSFIYFAGSTNATIAVGAAAPIVLPSRAGALETKLAALAVGALLAKQNKEVAR